MTYLWINPVSERMVSEKNLKQILTEHQLTQVRCREDWGGIVLKQYAKLAEEYAEFIKTTDELNESDYSVDDWKYYLDAQTRITQKLTEIE